MKVSEGKRYYLAYSIARTTSKHVVRGRRKRLAYLVVYANESYHKVSEGRKIYLIYLVFCIVNN